MTSGQFACAISTKCLYHDVKIQQLLVLTPPSTYAASAPIAMPLSRSMLARSAMPVQRCTAIAISTVEDLTYNRSLYTLSTQEWTSNSSCSFARAPDIRYRFSGRPGLRVP
jgi:hypothetical protein